MNDEPQYIPTWIRRDSSDTTEERYVAAFDALTDAEDQLAKRERFREMARQFTVAWHGTRRAT